MLNLLKNSSFRKTISATTIFFMALLSNASANAANFNLDHGGTFEPTNPTTYADPIVRGDGDSATITNNTTGLGIGINGVGTIETTDGNLTFTNKSGNVVVNGGISTTSGDLDFTHQTGAGTTTANLTLGTNTSSTVNLLGGTLAGNIAIGNENQSVTFAGGSQTGNITGGTGSVVIDSENATTLGGSVDVSTITINDNRTLSNANDHNITANISIGDGATFNFGGGTLVGDIDGTDGGNGTLLFSEAVTVSNQIGTNDALEFITVNESVTLNSGGTISANTTNIRNNKSLTLGADTTLLSEANISNNGKVILQDGAAIRTDLANTIDQIVSGDGIVEVASGASATLEGVIGTQDNLGTDEVDERIAAVSLLSNSTLDIAANSTINATQTKLDAGSNLRLNSNAVVNSQIESAATKLAGQGTGTVTILGDGVNMNGDIGSSNRYVSKLDLDSASTLTLDGTNDIYVDSVELDFASDLSINDSTVKVTNGINGETDGSGTLILTDDRTLTNNDFQIGNNASIGRLTVEDGVNVSASSGYNIGADNVYLIGDLTLDQGSVGNETKISGTAMINTNGSLTLNSNTVVTGEIYGDADGAGTVNISGTYSSAAAIGTLNNGNNSLGLVNLSSGAILNSSHNLDASTITLDSNSTLNIGGGTLTGAINGAVGGAETVNFNSSTTLAAGTTIGNNIDDVNIANGVDVTANANISATRVDVGTGTSGSLSVGTGVTVSSAVNLADNATLNLANTASVTGEINGAASGQGNVSVANSASVTQGSSIGATNKIETLELGADSTYTVGANTFKATEAVLEDGATMNISTGTLEATIKGSENNVGTVNLTQDRTVESGTSLGIEGAALNRVNVSASRTVALNESVVATTTAIGNGAQATLAASESITGDVTLANTASTLVLSNNSSVVGAINGATAGDQGVLNIASDAAVSLSGNVGATNALRSVVISDEATLTTGTNQLRVHETNGSITLGTDSNLVIGTGAVSGKEIDGTGANRGVVIFNGNNTIAAGTLVGSTNGLSQVQVAFGKTVTISDDIKATTLVVGKSFQGSTAENTTSSLTLSTDSDLTGNAEIGENSTLTLAGTSSVSGTINGSDTGIGNLSITGNNIALQGNVGATKSLASVTVAGNGTLTAGTNTIHASDVTIAENGLLITEAAITGAINGAETGVGTLHISDSVTFGANTTIGATHKLQNITVLDGTFTVGANVSADEISVLEDNGFNIGAGKTVTANVILSNAATVTVNDNSVITGTIDGEVNSRGVLAISENSSFSAGGNIGGQQKLAEILINENATFNTGTHGVDATAINAQTGSTFNLGNQNTVTGNITLTAATMNFGNFENVVVGNVTSAGESTLNLGNAGHQVQGNLTITESDVIKVTADSDGYGALNLIGGGAAGVAQGASLDVTIDSRLAYANAGTAYNIITSGEGSNINVIEDANVEVNALGSNRMGLLTFKSSVSDNKLIMTINRDSASDVSSNGSVQAAYNAINQVGGVATGELKTVQDFVVTSTTTTAGERQDVLESITQNDVGINQAIFGGINSSINVIENRMSNLNLSAPSYKVTDSRGNKVKGLDKSASADAKSYGSDSSTESAMGRSVWGQIIGTTAKQSTADGFNGYDAKTRGLAFGIDQQIEKDLLVGAAFNINNTDITSANSAKRVTVDSYQLTLYGEKKYDEYFLDGFVAGALNRFESDRRIALVGKTASATYDGYSYSAKTRVGMINRLENGFDIIPHVGLMYAYNSSTNYQESGAGTLDLSVNSSAAEMLIGDVGVALSYDAELFQYKLRPEFKVSYGHDFIGNEQASTANFVGQGALLNISNSRSDRNMIRLGLGTDIYSIDQFTLNASYLLEKRQTYQSHTGLIKAKYSF